MNYDKTDLLSTLNYIKIEYGSSPFKDGKIIGYLSDLAPSLKREKSFLKRLVDKGLMKKIAENASYTENEQRKILYNTKRILVDEEFIKDDIAISFINILAKVFSYKTFLELDQICNNETKSNILDSNVKKEPSKELFVSFKQINNENKIDKFENFKRIIKILTILFLVGLSISALIFEFYGNSTYVLVFVCVYIILILLKDNILKKYYRIQKSIRDKTEKSMVETRNNVNQAVGSSSGLGCAGIIFSFLCIIYIISPIDCVPDVIPILGWIDDIFIIYLLFKNSSGRK